MFQSPGSNLRAAGVVLLTLAIFAVDAFTALDIAIAVLYVVVVLCATSVWSRRGVLLTGVACAALTVGAFALTHHEVVSSPMARCLVSVAAIAITTVLALAGMAATDALRQRSESLRLSEAFLASTQRISRTSSFRFQAPGGAMHWSEEAARIYGVGLDVTPTPALVRERTHPDDWPLLDHVIARADRGEATIELRHRLRMADGTVKHVHMIARLAAVHDGQFEYLGALMDVSAAHEAAETLHRTQAQLAHATRVTTLGELAASIAHEVNQPLAAVSTNGNACLRWLNRPEPDLLEARLALDRILADTCRASEVIKRIRALARKGEALRLPLDVNTLLRDTAALVQRELSNHRIVLELNLAPGLPPVEGDAVQLQQVVINLLMNAMQAIDGAAPEWLRRQQRIVLSTRLDGGQVEIEVADSGPGLSELQAGRLFEAFYTTKADGMGMGLAICRSIVEAHGGSIRAVAHAGPGATLAFTLPCAAAKVEETTNAVTGAPA
ncbi:ATP-binding protein [Massilia aurea]|uniref:ATP-binding protein n=1 Tax=Massilia aurea TaxID=373040 RepID=UPI000F2DD8B0|nr:ATP-binding protein [Massilia aurea]